MKPFIFDMFMNIGVAIIVGLLGVGAFGTVGSFFDYRLTNDVAFAVWLAFTLSTWVELICIKKL